MLKRSLYGQRGAGGVVGHNHPLVKRYSGGLRVVCQPLPPCRDKPFVDLRVSAGLTSSHSSPPGAEFSRCASACQMRRAVAIFSIPLPWHNLYLCWWETGVFSQQ